MPGSCVARKAGNRRKAERLFNGESAYAAIRDFDAQTEVFGLTKGQFSVIDLIDAVLRVTGPADVVLSTWTAATADMSRASLFMRQGRIRSLLLLVDYSFATRQPAFCAEMVELFGADAIRATANHAKFGLFRSEDWRVVLQTSMNLNRNSRIESFWLANDRQLFDAFRGLVDEIFDIQAPSEGIVGSPSARRSELRRLGVAPDASSYDLKPIGHLLD